MLNSQLTEILKTFTKMELRRFNRFVHSSYFNTSQATARTFEVIQLNLNYIENGILTKENIFASVHPGRKYDDALMRKYLSNLIKLSEEFMALKVYTGKSRIKKRYLLEELRLRRLHQLYKISCKKAEAELSSPVKIDRDYFLDKYFLEHEKIYYNVTYNNQEKIITNVIKRSDQFFYFMLQELVHNRLDITINESVFNFSSDFTWIDRVYSGIDMKSLSSNIKNDKNERRYFIQLYFYLWDCLSEEPLQSYNEAKKLLEKIIGKLDYDIKNLACAIIESYCYRKIRTGHDEFYHEIFSIYELMLKENVFLYPDNNFKFQEFRNVLVTALALKKFDWSFSFVNTYSVYLDIKIRKNTVNYSIGSIYYSMKEYTKAMEYLSTVRYEDRAIEISVKNMMLIIAYELRMFESALSHIDAYKKFLSYAVDMSDQRKEINRNFLKFYSKMLNNTIKTPRIEELYSLKTVVSSSDSVHGKHWLLEKIDTLISLSLQNRA